MICDIGVILLRWMTLKHLTLLAILVSSVALPAWAAPKSKTKKATTPQSATVKAAPKPSSAAKKYEASSRSLEVFDGTDLKFYRYKFHSMMGINIASGSAFVTGFQMGYAPWRSKPIYFGPDLTFSLFSPGSLFATLAGGWYEFRIQGVPRLNVSLGGFVGPGFPSLLPAMNDTVFVAMAFGAVSQELDDLVSFRAEFRPGILGSDFAFMMNFSLAFRFT